MLKKMPLVTVPNPKLREKSKRVQYLDKKTVKFLADLGMTLVKKDDPPGVGLSGIQVGVDKRVFFTYLPKDKSLPSSQWKPELMELECFINPAIVDTSKGKIFGGRPKKPTLEGCLSIPSLYGPVLRYEWIKIEYYSLKFDPMTLEAQNAPQTDLEPLKTVATFKDFPARVIQHEYDHLEGILFTDYTLKDGLPLYFDDGQKMAEIPDPHVLIHW